ncbi:PhzF family phenazine biosynthesis protein [Acetobacterium bakii]|uniref:Phenazine biosynthesis protein PhzF n=1 Tax=Acetobacterium bakii TaxID=52689 RepID=A0A0L6TXD3_9FIRM|nr:PhzF family phenazine biosynthesis protein [Acetobacterium bakii]KNZ40924.1 phenazine biosynthesis protein PhzF [Acetobacterium bakii]
MKIKAYTLNAFAKTIDGGNPAGVVLNADSLSENNMKKIAGILGFSETAFLMRSDCADFKVRFFTPTEEVDLCGHATIGAFYTLLSQNVIKPGNYSQETKAGVLNVKVNDNLSIMMTQKTPIFYEIIGKEEIADSLNLHSDQMLADLPVQIVSTGLRDIMVPIKNMKILNGINPDFEKVKAISRKYKTIGYHLFTLESINGSDACCRNFAPLYGIPEESATGTSNGALGCYLFKYGKLKAQTPYPLVFEQGYAMKKPSEIMVSIISQGQEVVEVRVGGIALNLSEIEIDLR